MEATAMKKLESLNFVKAMAITLVVANHAQLSSGLHGGLNALLLVSGISMATFAFQGTTAYTLAAFRRFTLRIAVPAFLIAIVWAVAVSDIRWIELGFISNWFYKSRVVLFPIWYVQVIVQIMIVLSLIFWLFDLTPAFVRSPLTAASVALLLSMGICLGSYAVWDTDHLHDKLPHLLVWNFVLGWLYWAMAIKGERSIHTKLAFTVVLVGCEALVFLLAGANQGEARFFWMSGFSMVLIWTDHVRLPALLARFCSLIGQATLFVFFLHYYFFWIVIRLGRLLGHAQSEIHPLLLMIPGVVGPVLVWAAFRAIRCAWVRTRPQSPAGSGAGALQLRAH